MSVDLRNTVRCIILLSIITLTTSVLALTAVKFQPMKNAPQNFPRFPSVLNFGSKVLLIGGKQGDTACSVWDLPLSLTSVPSYDCASPSFLRIGNQSIARVSEDDGMTNAVITVDAALSGMGKQEKAYLINDVFDPDSFPQEVGGTLPREGGALLTISGTTTGIPAGKNKNTQNAVILLGGDRVDVEVFSLAAKKWSATPSVRWPPAHIPFVCGAHYTSLNNNSFLVSGGYLCGTMNLNSKVFGCSFSAKFSEGNVLTMTITDSWTISYAGSLKAGSFGGGFFGSYFVAVGWGGSLLVQDLFPLSAATNGEGWKVFETGQQIACNTPVFLPIASSQAIAVCGEGEKAVMNLNTLLDLHVDLSLVPAVGETPSKELRQLGGVSGVVEVAYREALKVVFSRVAAPQAASLLLSTTPDCRGLVTSQGEHGGYNGVMTTSKVLNATALELSIISLVPSFIDPFHLYVCFSDGYCSPEVCPTSNPNIFGCISGGSCARYNDYATSSFCCPRVKETIGVFWRLAPTESLVFSPRSVTVEPSASISEKETISSDLSSTLSSEDGVNTSTVTHSTLESASLNNISNTTALSPSIENDSASKTLSASPGNFTPTRPITPSGGVSPTPVLTDSVPLSVSQLQPSESKSASMSMSVTLEKISNRRAAPSGLKNKLIISIPCAAIGLLLLIALVRTVKRKVGRGRDTSGGLGDSLLNTMENKYTALMDGNKYKLLHMLGKGGYGMVFLALRNADNSHVALKYITLKSDYDRVLAMREFSIIRKVKHPNTMPIIDMFMNWQEQVENSEYGSIGGDRRNGGGGGVHGDFEPFRVGDDVTTAITRPRYVAIVSKYFCEGDLKKYIYRLRKNNLFMPEEQIVVLSCQICIVLSYLHSFEPKIVHRDLKPENVLMDCDGAKAVITDFGLAFNDVATHMTTQAGSLPFVAPECWGRYYTETIDIWSLGCVVYAMCTQRVTGDDARIMFNDVDDPGFAESIEGEICHNPTEEMPRYSKELCDLIMQMLEKDGDIRLSAVQVTDKLLALCKERGYTTQYIDAALSYNNDKLKSSRTLFSDDGTTTRSSKGGDGNSVIQ